ncbi:hypothetical protein THIOKS12830017 [Thiocapsa sp. KS1]|nr:hypothetical protein THIOKS12830017 [Thiocapsa sp. KS1]
MRPLRLCGSTTLFRLNDPRAFQPACRPRPCRRIQEALACRIRDNRAEILPAGTQVRIDGPATRDVRLDTGEPTLAIDPKPTGRRFCTS